MLASPLAVPELALVPLLDPLPLPDDAPDVLLPEVWPDALPLVPLPVLAVPLLPAPLAAVSPLDEEPDVVEPVELVPLPKSPPVGGVEELQPTVDATASAATRLIEWMIFIVCLS